MEPMATIYYIKTIWGYAEFIICVALKEKKDFSSENPIEK